jgi:hypothetical protein
VPRTSSSNGLAVGRPLQTVTRIKFVVQAQSRQTTSPPSPLLRATDSSGRMRKRQKPFAAWAAA